VWQSFENNGSKGSAKNGRKQYKTTLTTTDTSLSHSEGDRNNVSKYTFYSISVSNVSN